MPYYQIRAVDSAGREISRTVEAENDAQLLSFLSFLNLTPVRIERRPDLVGRLSRLLNLRRIKRKDLVDLFENLHLLARSGVPLSTGMWDLAEDVENPAVKEMLQDIAYRIQSGLSISSAMARYERVFGSIAVSLIRIGEETGNLDRIFRDISEHYRRLEEFLSRVRQALIYPAFALTTITIALLFWLLYVLPKLAELFSNLRVELPAITVAVLHVSGFLQEYAPLAVALIAAAGLAFAVARSRSERFRYVTDRTLLRIPVVGSVLLSFNYAFFSEYMRLMVSAGVSLYDTLRTLETSFNNRVFRKAVGDLREHVTGGGTISEGMRRTRLFPSLMVRMVAVGEETGGLEEQLSYLAEYYYGKLDHITQNIAKVIEPLIIITVGTFMAVVMISLLLPIYDLIGQIGRSF